MEPWRNPANLADIEHALDNGALYGAAGNGRFWLLRRNGKTQTWKRDKTRFRVPAKMGLKDCCQITNDTLQQWPDKMRIADSRKNAETSIPGRK